MKRTRHWLFLLLTICLPGCNKPEPYHGRYVHRVENPFHESIKAIYNSPIMRQSGQKPPNEILNPKTIMQLEIILTPGNRGIFRTDYMEEHFRYKVTGDTLRIPTGLFGPNMLMKVSQHELTLTIVTDQPMRFFRQ